MNEAENNNKYKYFCLIYLSPYILGDIHVSVDYSDYSQTIPRFLFMAYRLCIPSLYSDVFTTLYVSVLVWMSSPGICGEGTFFIYNMSIDALIPIFIPCPTDCWRSHTLDNSRTVPISIQTFVEQHQAIIYFCVFIFYLGPSGKTA